MDFTTHKSFLERIKTGDENAWIDFYNNYCRLIFSIGRHYQLADDDCQDLVQQVMMIVFEARNSFNYDPAKGKFRSYLWKVTRNTIGNIKRADKYNKASDQDIDLDAIPSQDENDFFDKEWRHCLLNVALKCLNSQVEDMTFDIFQMYVLQGVKPEVIAKSFNIAVSTVYVHKNRCLAHLKDIIKELEENDVDFQANALT